MFDDEDVVAVVDTSSAGRGTPSLPVIACRGVWSGAKARAELNRPDSTRNNTDFMVKVSFVRQYSGLQQPANPCKWCIRESVRKCDEALDIGFVTSLNVPGVFRTFRH